MTETDRKSILLHLIEDAREGISTEELEAIIQWIEDTRLSAMMVELWEEGRIALRWKDGGVTFQAK